MENSSATHLVMLVVGKDVGFPFDEVFDVLLICILLASRKPIILVEEYGIVLEWA
jgi:hypothetical protein